MSDDQDRPRMFEMPTLTEFTFCGKTVRVVVGISDGRLGVAGELVYVTRRCTRPLGHADRCAP